MRSRKRSPLGAALARIAARVRTQLGSPELAGLRAARRPLFTGIGASYAALAVPVQQLREAGVVTQRVLSSEIETGTAGFDTDCLIAVSQGGRSPRPSPPSGGPPPASRGPRS
ncbi:hypothetical protein [Streptomyces xanthophaeus]|uniref:hypothetical protein n=1 Tax=Streptomyces xanthophaeus TaxID=67385 RepID=UPI00068A71F7|nr:hypothetical protein [Streptomyces xanthophaeus]